MKFEDNDVEIIIENGELLFEIYSAAMVLGQVMVSKMWSEIIYGGTIMITIKNLRKEKPTNPWDVKVDRSSWFGNGFVMKNESERDKVCDQYKEWFYEEFYDSAMQAELYLLKETLKKYGKLNLFCWCAPKRCHAETIKRYLEKQMSKVDISDTMSARDIGYCSSYNKESGKCVDTDYFCDGCYTDCLKHNN